MDKPLRHFHHVRTDAWKALSDQLHGRFIDNEGWRQDRAVVDLDDWIVTIDFHSEPGYKAETIYTRLRAPYVNPEGFHFSVFHQGVFNRIARVFGYQDVNVGHEPFDSMFIVKANDPQKIKRLLDDDRLRDLIKSEPHIYLHVRDSGDWFSGSYPEGVDELVLEVEGRVEDLDRLKRLYDLFALILHKLCDIGQAYEGAPRGV